ncbi:MAG TPA: hypothetical protein VJ801_10395, partial [Polyangia bacterium]|nr:hypothetical protein [Polyangia bacterium]
MASNILKEYLVKLGFDADQQAFGRMTGMLAAADRAVDLHATGMVKSLVGAQSAILGMFTATSAAIVGMMDKVAMADQGYRLYGLRMLMTTESARKLDMITKALGVDLATIVWDKESHERAVIMAQDMDLMKEKLGPNYEANMKGIRDLGFEFKRLELAGKFLGMSFVSKLFEKLDLGDVGDKLKNWVEWIQDHIPEIADKLSTYAVPVLRKTWEILEAVVEAGKGFCVMFTNLVGLLSGDKSIQGTAFSFDNLATSISHVGDWMVKFFKWMATAETMLAHFFSALSLAISGEFAAASKEFLAGLNDMGANVSGALGGAIYGAIGGSVIPGVGTVGGAIAGGVAGYAVSLTRELVEGPKPEEAPVDQRDRSFLERFPGPPGAAQAVPAA